MSNLTFKIKHNENFAEELKKARLVAEFGLETGTRSSKDVKQFGLKSAVANQILKKYVSNKKIKTIKNVKLVVPGQAINFKKELKLINIPCLKLELPFDKNIEKINQIELDSEYAFVTCTVTDKSEFEPTTVIGIDRNATGHVAVCAVGNKIYKFGKKCQHVHKKYKDIKTTAQSHSNFKFLKKLKNRESRITRDLNHKISRKIVNLAVEQNAIIKLENLKGFRNSKTGKKNQGKKLNSIKSNWSYYQLEQFIVYKAKLLGVRVAYVDPAYTSQTCSKCGQIGTRDKKVFKCQHCGHNDHADANAAFNISISRIVRLLGRSTVDRDAVESTSDCAQVAMTGTKSTTEPLTLQGGE